MNNTNKPKPDLDNLLKRPLKDDLPPEVETRMNRQFLSLKRRLDRAERLPEPNGWPWARGPFRKEILAIASAAMIVLGLTMQLSGSKTALAHTIEQLKGYIAGQGKYTAKHTDAEAESKLSSINWDTDEIILFVGRLIASKGVHSIITSLPFVFKEYPNAKMVIIGHGPLREPLEILIWALQNKYTQLVHNIIKWARELEGTKPGPLHESAAYLKALENDGKLDNYFKIASETISFNRIIFTGYLTHKELQYIFPASDVAVFPSVIAEAGPLVFLEAIASGCFPIGTYFAGMAASIDSIKGSIPDEDLDYMKLSPDAAETVSDMVQKISGALALRGRHSAALRKVAVERYDWSNISKRFYNSY